MHICLYHLWLLLCYKSRVVQWIVYVYLDQNTYYLVLYESLLNAGENFNYCNKFTQNDKTAHNGILSWNESWILGEDFDQKNHWE